MTRSASQLTDDEATLLSLLVRVEAATAYQLSKVYAQSPVSNFGTSKGKIYPMIRRLKTAGLISASAIPGDARNSELLRCTARGRSAVSQWIQQIRPGHLLLEDPFRTMVQSFDLLTKNEQLAWIEDARSSLTAKLLELDQYGATVDVPYKEYVHDNAVASLETRLAWLERLRKAIAGGSAAPKRRAPRLESVKSRTADTT